MLVYVLSGLGLILVGVVVFLTARRRRIPAQGLRGDPPEGHPLRVDHSYVARYRFGPVTVVFMVLGVAGGVLGLVLDVPGDLGIVLVAGSFTVAVTLLALYGSVIFMRRAGLRVDAGGILLGGRPPLYRMTSVFVPWHKIETVYLFRVRQGLMVSTYVGLIGVDGVAPIGQVMPTMVAATIWHVPIEAVKASRPAYGWDLDADAFIAAVARFQNRVSVIDLTAVAPMQQGLGS